MEGSHSVVKELLENSIDAEANAISVYLDVGGHDRIRIRDNGIGMIKEDLKLCIQEHATSKIQDEKDLFHISSLGFRGEALSSISAISHFKIQSKSEIEKNGHFIQGKEGRIESEGKAALDQGTDIVITNIFYNTPARRKFLKSAQSELRSAKELIQKYALSYPRISFELVSDQKNILKLPARSSREERVFDLFGKEFSENLTPLEGVGPGFSLSGLISLPSYHRGSRKHQYFYVNNRYIEFKYLQFFINRAYENFLDKGTYPIVFLFLDIDPEYIDVNVHPSKKEIRFKDQNLIQQSIVHSISRTLQEHDFANLRNRSLSRNSRFHEKNGKSNELRRRSLTSQTDFRDDDPKDYQSRIAFSTYPNQATQEEESNSSKDYPEFLFVQEESSYNAASLKKLTDNYQFLGIFAQTYILIEWLVEESRENSQLVLIDFHAAHERIWYERFTRQYNQHTAIVESTPLLFPFQIQLTLDEISLIEEQMEVFTNNGFDIDILANQEIQILRIPYYVKLRNIESIIQESLAFFNKDKQLNTNFTDEFLKDKSCKAAVKAGERLTESEVDALIQDLFQCEQPARCPHGRPVYQIYGKNYIDRLFKRLL